MFDYTESKHSHFDAACRAFALANNVETVARAVGMSPQILRNKLNPDQPHKLTVDDLLAIVVYSDDARLIDGVLAQLNCLPSVPLNEARPDRMTSYVLQATAEIGKVAAVAVAGKKMSPSCKSAFVENVNAGIRCLSLIALSVHTRVQSNPALASTVDVLSGISASVGLS